MFYCMAKFFVALHKYFVARQSTYVGRQTLFHANSVASQRNVFLRNKVKVYSFSVFSVSLTSSDICKHAVSKSIAHLLYSDLHGNIF